MTHSCEASRKSLFDVILGQGNICTTALERWAKSTQSTLELIDFREKRQKLLRDENGVCADRTG